MNKGYTMIPIDELAEVDLSKYSSVWICDRDGQRLAELRLLPDRRMSQAYGQHNSAATTPLDPNPLKVSVDDPTDPRARERVLSLISRRIGA